MIAALMRREKAWPRAHWQTHGAYRTVGAQAMRHGGMKLPIVPCEFYVPDVKSV
jgi:hypothetical protein